MIMRPAPTRRCGQNNIQKDMHPTRDTAAFIHLMMRPTGG